MLISVMLLDTQKGVLKVAIREKASPIMVFILVSTELALVLRSRPCLPLAQIFLGCGRLRVKVQWACQFWSPSAAELS